MGNLFFEGLVLQASLIFALGAQNLFVLESGLRRKNHLAVSFTCFVCDLTLILLGVAGAATLFTNYPGLKILVGLLGVIFMFSYGMNKILRPVNPIVASERSELQEGIKKSIVLAFTFSVFNPHAYLDAFILIGGFSAKYAAMEDRLVLGLGAAFYSGCWFLILSSLSSTMKPFLEHPKRLKMIMTLAGGALVFLSGKLSIDVLGWIQEESPHLTLNHFINYSPPPGSLYTSILF